MNQRDVETKQGREEKAKEKEGREEKARPAPLLYFGTYINKIREMLEQRLLNLATVIGKERMTRKTMVRRGEDKRKRGKRNERM